MDKPLSVGGLRVVTRFGEHGRVAVLVVDTPAGPVEAVVSGAFWKGVGDAPPLDSLAGKLRGLAEEIDEMVEAEWAEEEENHG